ncbi:MAG: hypothetical protein ABSA47_18695, partial [Verrucomicrobiota bacterium]
HLSFSFNLNEIALATFRVGDNIKTAQESIPVLGTMLSGIRPGTLATLAIPNLAGAWLALAAMLALAAWIIHKRVKPE